MPAKRTRNKFEKKIEEQLKQSKLKFEYETEKLPYVLHKNYIPDFILHTPSGKVYVECKGYFRPDAKLKMAAIKKQRPDLDIRIVFYSFNKSYSKWAIKHGFKYSIGNIPNEWFLGL